MIKQFIVYKNTGEILRAGTCPESDIPLQAQEGEFAVEGEGQDDTHWVDSSEVKVKTELPLVVDTFSIVADGITVASITGIPSGVYVSLNGDLPIEVIDGVVHFKTVDIGNHNLVFTGIPYLDKEITIGAV